MTLADALAEEPRDTLRSTCPVARLKSQLDERDREALTATLIRIASTPAIERSNGNSQQTVSWLRNVLINNGHAIGSSSIRRHLRRECSCGDI